MANTGIAGNHGDKVRSDCKVTLQIIPEGGRSIEIKSKVKALFGDSINQIATEILDFFQIEHAKVLIEDSGALPHVIAARLEAAIKQVSDSLKEFLLPFNHDGISQSKPDRFRLSRLYLPGNNPAMMINAGIHHPDGIILDLEDSVAPAKKEEARILVRNTLRAVDFYGAERMVRINQLPMGLDDLRMIVPHQAELILIPKCEHEGQIKQVDELVSSILQDDKSNPAVFLMPIIESALGVENAYKIATASGRNVAMAIGLEDYTADLGVSRTESSHESFYARTRLVNACKAAGIQPIDSVYSDVANESGLRHNVAESRSLGFEGMGCIHPSQIRVIQEGFAPTNAEIEKAEKIIHAYKEANEKGLGVVSLGSKMIDAPVVKRAEQTLSLSRKLLNR